MFLHHLLHYSYPIWDWVTGRSDIVPCSIDERSGLVSSNGAVTFAFLQIALTLGFVVKAFINSGSDDQKQSQNAHIQRK